MFWPCVVVLHDLIKTPKGLALPVTGSLRFVSATVGNTKKYEVIKVLCELGTRLVFALKVTAYGLMVNLLRYKSCNSFEFHGFEVPLEA